MTFPLEDVLRATGGKLLQGARGTVFSGVSTDSRTVGDGDLFVALQGVRFDGHHFVLEALKKKAGGVLIKEGRAKDFRWDGDPSQAIIAVTDTLLALGELARERRRAYGPTVVGITGSNGKTTTKEMTSACLQVRFPVLKTAGNLNNLIGLPLTLLRLTAKERVVVLEMGMNVPGEIRRLTEIAEPDVGLITNIHPVHLEGLGSLDRLTEEKGELFRGMKPQGAIVVNRDDPRVVALADRFEGRKVTYGIQGPADVTARKIQSGREGTSFTVTSGSKEIDMRLSFLGRHFVSNALSSVAVASLFGISPVEAKEALESLRPPSMRMEVCPLPGGKTLINDAYNANPRSMETALEVLVASKGDGRAIAVLGDMLELGEMAEEAHIELGRRVEALSVDLLITLGDHASRVVEAAVSQGFDPNRARGVRSHREAVSVLREVAREGDWILLKGSRGMALEKIAEALKEGGI